MNKNRYLALASLILALCIQTSVSASGYILAYQSRDNRGPLLRIDLPADLPQSIITFRQLAEIAESQLGYPVNILAKGRNLTDSDALVASIGSEVITILKKETRETSPEELAERERIRQQKEAVQAARLAYIQSVNDLQSMVDRIKDLDAREQIFAHLTSSNQANMQEYRGFLAL